MIEDRGLPIMIELHKLGSSCPVLVNIKDISYVESGIRGEYPGVAISIRGESTTVNVEESYAAVKSRITQAMQAVYGESVEIQTGQTGRKGMNTFAELPLSSWKEMERPFIAVFAEELAYIAKVYDGAKDTGLFVERRILDTLIHDIKRTSFTSLRLERGPADPENLICVFC